MNGLAVAPSPMEDVNFYRMTEGDTTFDTRWHVIDESLVEITQLQVDPKPTVYTFAPVDLQFVYPIRVVSPTEIDIDRDAMVTGKHYNFELGDIPLVAVKQTDGTIEFFSFY